MGCSIRRCVPNATLAGTDAPTSVIPADSRPRTAGRRGGLRCPSIMLPQGRRVRVLEIRHEHLRARVECVDHHRVAVGPVISTRLSCRSAGAAGTRQSSSRTERVSSRKSVSSPARNLAARDCRPREALSRSAPNSRWSRVTNSIASLVRRSSVRNWASITFPP
jgi:hypothetical protein